MNKCKKTTVTVPTYSTVYYDRSSTAISSPFTAWTSSYATDCGNFIYTVTYYDTNTGNYTNVPASSNAITYTSSTRNLRVYTTKSSDVGIYTIKIFGQTGTEPVTRTEYQ